MIKGLFLAFHSLTMLSALFAAVLFLIFFSRSHESVNLLMFVPAVVVSGILILNSYAMYQGQFHTGYFTAMRVITIIGGLFALLALFALTQAFSGPNSTGGVWNEVFASFLKLPKLLVTQPQAALVYAFPLFAALTAITSFFIERPQ